MLKGGTDAAGLPFFNRQEFVFPFYGDLPRCLVRDLPTRLRGGNCASTAAAGRRPFFEALLTDLINNTGIAPENIAAESGLSAQESVGPYWECIHALIVCAGAL